MNINTLNTGDLLLFTSPSYIGMFIDYFTGSKYSHCGIIIKDPDFGPNEMKGVYILESTGLDHKKESEDNEIKFGVQLRKLEDTYKDYNGSIFHRKLICNRNKLFYDKSKKTLLLPLINWPRSSMDRIEVS